MRICSLLLAMLWCTSGGAVVSTAPDYLNTDTLVQLRQLHPLKQHPLRENSLMLGVGYTDILDTYLSPEKYRGTDLRFISHTRREKDSTCLVHQLLHEAASPLPTTARAMGAR